MGNVPVTIPFRRAEIKENLVTTKFSETMAFANTFYGLVTGYLTDLNSLVNSIPNINNIIDIPDVVTEVDIGDIESLLREFPENPLADTTWPDPPTDTLIFNEDAGYSDSTFQAFLASVQSNLTQDLENGIATREQERDAAAVDDAISAAANEWADRGFELPGGGLFNNISRIHAEGINNSATKTREAATRVSQILLQNSVAALGEVTKFEASRMTYMSGYWSRQIEAAKSLLDRGTQIFVGKIEVIKAQASAYQAASGGFAAHAGALSEFAKAKVESLRGALEYAKVQVDAQVATLNSRLKELEIKYSTSLGGVKAQADLAAQIMSSALAAVSASASMTTGDSVNMSTNADTSENWNHNLDT